MFIGSPPSPDAVSPAAEDETLELAQATAPGGQTPEQISAVEGGEPIGQVSAVQGTTFITRVDGTKLKAGDGTPIFQGDVIETEGGGAVGITFADDSTFSMAENGSMVIDEMVYDPGTQTGTSVINIAEGVFTFVSGQIAKTGIDAMVITTPVAVIGIRGTSGGGRAGPEGTQNTYSLFADPDGTIGEMAIQTLGGSQILNGINQTTQISSAYVPPTVPVTLPPQAIQRFYAKAAAVAPKPIFTEKPAAAPAGDVPPGDAPAAGDPLAPDAPAGDLPAGDLPPGEEGIDQAATEAFDLILAAGGSLDEAMAAAAGAANEAGIKAVLAENPDHFGSQEAGFAVLDRITDDVFLGVTGRIDPLSAGTGSGAGYRNFTERTFFSDEIGHLIDDAIGDLVGGLFGDFLDFGALGGGDEFFDLFLDDPFADFNDEFFADDDIFFEEQFLFDDRTIKEEPLFDDTRLIEFVDDSINLIGPDPSVPTVTIPVSGVGTFAFVNAQNDIFIGGAGNDSITITGQAQAGDVFDGGGGADTLTLASDFSHILRVFNLDSIDLSASTGFNAIQFASAGTLSITLNTVGSFNFAGTSVDGSPLDQTFVIQTLVDGTNNSLRLTGSGGNDTVNFADGTNVIDNMIGVETVNFAAAANSSLTFQTPINNVNIISGGGGATQALTLNGAGNTLTATGTFTSFTGSTGADTVTLGNTGATLGGVTAVETIIGGAGTDSITLGAGGQTISISKVETLNSGTGADNVTHTGTSNITINASTGLDTFNLDGSGTQTVAYSARNQFGDTLSGFSTATDVIDTSAGGDFNFTQAAAAIAATGFVDNATSLNIAADTNAAFEFTQATSSLAGTATAGTALALGQAALVGNLLTGSNITTNLIILYDNATTANAAVYAVTDANADGATTASEIELIAFIANVGADNLSAANFTV